MWYYCNNCSYLSSRYVYTYLVGGPMNLSCGYCGQAMTRPGSGEIAVLERHAKKHVVNQWQTFACDATPYSCIIWPPMQPIGFTQPAQTQPLQSHSVHTQTAPQISVQPRPSSPQIGAQIGPQIPPQQIAPQQIGPQIGPQLGQHPSAPSRVFSVSNANATEQEVLIGKYLLIELESEGVTKVVCASELKNSRSGDYRLYYGDGTILPADLYECNVNSVQNVVSYIQSKWNQADTIVILLPKNSTLNCDSVIATLQQSSAPTSAGVRIIPRRVLFIQPNSLVGLPPEFCFDKIKLHTFFKDPQKSLFKLQL